MRGLCKEEDYAFLGTSQSSTQGSIEDKSALEDNSKDEKEARVGDMTATDHDLRFESHF